MKKLMIFSVLLSIAATATAQDAPNPAQRGQSRPPGRSDPHIVPPRATPHLHS